MSTLASTASALAVSLALSAIFAGPALGTAQVFLNSDGRLSVTVDAVSGGDGDHGVLVEPFVDVTRNGFRAGQTALGVPPMIPPTLVLKPGLIIHSVYNGYWFWGRPSVTDLWHDLRAVSREIRPDWDLSTPGLREAWDAGGLSPFHGWNKPAAGSRTAAEARSSVPRAGPVSS